MISKYTLEILIASFCAFNDPNIPRDYKEACMEHIVNCSVGPNGRIFNEQVNKCRGTWVSKSATK